MTSFGPGAISSRDKVCGEHRSQPVPGRRPEASLNAGSDLKSSRSSASLQPQQIANTLADHVDDRVDDAPRIATIGNTARQTLRHTETLPGKRKQHHATVRRDTAAVERGRTFLPR